MINLPEVAIKKHFENKKFHTKKKPIFMSDCYDDGCKLNGDFKDYVILNGDNIVFCDTSKNCGLEIVG